MTAFIIYITFSLIQMPDVALASSTKGLNLWWSIVFPSLLPFFIVAELLFGLGVVHGVGVLSEKIMRPLFNVPGSGGFVWVMGMASGYPAGAKWTRELRKSGQVTRIEAERLVAFTNASSPLFILSAVSVGFFGDPGLGLLLAVSHYGGCIVVGFLMKFYGYKDERSHYRTASFSIKDAFTAVHKAREEDGRPFGKLLGDAVIQSVQTLLLVGGFIIMFSVLTGLLKHSVILEFSFFILQLIQVPAELQFPLLTGLLELTTGIGEVTSSNAPLLIQLGLASFMLGFHGFSIQAQIASILADTDIRFAPYFFARIIHGLAAALLVTTLYRMTNIASSNSINVSNITAQHNHSYLEFMYMYGPILTILTIASALILSHQKIKQSQV
nr:sporulation integral membrane protein YlbJ [Halobacillus sp. A5]